MSSNLISIIAVTKKFGDKTAVDNLSLDIRSGELFAFLGPNGAGKTTTIKMVAGLLRPNQGRVLVCGVDMSAGDGAARREVSYVPDQPYLYHKLSGREFLQFIRDIYGLRGPAVDRYQEELIDTFEMRGYVDDLAETYSHGMRQRLAFAAALIHRPRVLVVDEPMVGLDPRSVRVVKDLLRKTANQGAAVMMSTHTLAMAEEMADRIGIIHHGRLVRCGTMLEIRANGASAANLEDFFLEVTADAER